MLTYSEGYFLNLCAVSEGKQRGFHLPSLVLAVYTIRCSGFLQADPGLCSQACLLAALRRRQCSSTSAFPASHTKVITCHSAIEATALLVGLSLDSSEENV